MGLSLHNGIAVLEGFFGHKTPFIRTPKFNATNENAGDKNNSYIKYKLNFSTLAELLLGIYFISAMIVGIFLKDYGMFLFHAMLAVGFITVSYQSFRLLWHAS